MSTLIVRKVAELRAMTRSWRQQGETIGVVPTMGALHAGHLSLVEAAKAQCDRVIVTLFVNPRQFNSPEDYATYPRTEESDAALLAPYAVDALFVPDGIEVYPEGHATTVSVAGVSEPLEGAHRPGHFDGVATVVTLLFNMTTPDLAFFGEKDWQQLQVIRRLVADLHLPIQIVACPTLRAGNGLALSSRNQRLTPEAREAASALFATLQRAAGRIAADESFAPALHAARRELQDMGFGPVEYLELRDGASLGAACSGQPARLLVAAWLDGVRLIDNVAVDLPS